ncbi:tyrosine-type recombinase/integrase, partial [bacterium]|nr:tyrosine-type recombinase/integrase [bacterium]
IIPSNPCTGIKLTSLLGPKPAVKKRIMLSEEELQGFLPTIALIGETNALVLRIMLATCVRTNELRLAKKTDIDFVNHTWWVPDTSVKTRSGFLVPLVPQVEQWFKRLIELSGDS